MFVEDKVDSLPLKGENSYGGGHAKSVDRQGIDETAPIVRGMTIDGKSAIDNVRIKAGTLFKAEVSVTDKENDSLAYVGSTERGYSLGLEVLMSHVRKNG